MIDASKLQAIKERAEKATVGPWHRLYKVGIEVHAENKWAPVISEDEGVVRYPDTDFIIHARQDIPELVAEIEQLRTAVKRIVTDCENAKERYVEESDIDGILEIAREALK